ncbi:hypothetical protein K2173_017424 [Erythroxylum novogranatense]|uniref:Uncharacterized protein n=1 Tax=Erythroxylum novogranatense TaxID=1862640 RepID=A0AAV8TKJ2_9ROSI|nr:hypothetical protein K2173_017424 [Erythroxylum novogranatense]
MGTKLEYAINLLTESPKASDFRVHSVDERCYLQARSMLKKDLQVSRSDKLISCSTNMIMPSSHSIDSIRETMQMHEDIFKYQVQELHRLYSVQRMLMEELKMETTKQNRKHWSPMTTTIIDIKSSQIINRLNSTAHHCSSAQYCLRDDHSTRERSGSCSVETLKTARGFDLQRPGEEDLSTGISLDDDKRASSSFYIQPHKTESKHDEDNEVELTLSIGGSSGKSTNCKNYRRLRGHRGPGFIDTMNKNDMKELDSPTSTFKSEHGEDCSGPATPMSNSSATFDEERKRPHWLFQGLSINRT